MPKRTSLPLAAGGRNHRGKECGALRVTLSRERERLWVVVLGHPIAQGLDPFIQLKREEMSGDVFDIPPPDELVLVSWFRAGEVFRSVCCFTHGRGRIFYFRPGHETFATYHDPQVKRIIANAVCWAAPGAAG